MTYVMPANQLGGDEGGVPANGLLYQEFPTVPHHVVDGLVHYYRAALGDGDEHDPAAALRLARAALVARVAAQGHAHT